MKYPTIISPAYGRDYKNKREVLADFEADKDFVVEDLFCGGAGRYINKADFPDGASVEIRYDHMRKLVVVKVKHKEVKA